MPLDCLDPATKRTKTDDAFATGAFEAFLDTFKTSPEESLTQAIGDVTIGEDDLSDDEYDMVEDDEARETRRKQKEASRGPQLKYKLMLQELADRKVDEVMIDLDDLSNVGGLHM